MRKTVDETMHVRGSVCIEQFRHGRRIDVRRFDNLIVTTGLQWFAGALSGDEASPENMKYIGIGTSTTAAATGQTALVAEVGSRATGTQTRVTTTLTSDTYQAVGTVSITDTWAVTECGLFSASSNGTMAARQTFAALNLLSGDTLQLTWRIKFAAG